MNFIKRVFDNQIDESVHLQFEKFSRGEFINKAGIKVKKTGKNYNIATTPEFANELVSTMAKKLGANSAKITGAMVSTSDLTGKIEFKNKKQFQGVKRYLIDKETTGEEILNLIKELPKTFFALTFDVGEERLKIKPKAPKSGKPGKKGEDTPKIDFCRLKTSDKEIVREFVFEKDEFKEAEIFHTFLINEIVVPEELKGSKDFAKIREKSKRKGKILRKAIIDGETISSEKEFIA